MKLSGYIMTAFVIIVSFGGCYNYVLTTDDVTKLVTDGSFAVATLSIRSNTTMPVVLDIYPTSVTVAPSDTVHPGGIVRLTYRTFLRTNRMHHVEIAAIPIGRTRQGIPLQSAKVAWDFSESDWQGTNQVVYVLEQTPDSTAVYFR